MEKHGKEGETPVTETELMAVSIRSTTEHEKFRGKAGGPSPKAKYDLMTDRD